MPKSWARASSSERERSVSIRPGAMLLTLTLGPTSLARHLTRAATPGRSTFEESRPCIGSRTDDEVIKSTEAPSFICGTSVRSNRTGPPRSRRNASSHCSSVNSSAGPKGGPPALTSTPSSVPKRSIATVATLSTPEGWETSAIHCSACSPSSRATSSMASPLRATRRTLAPSSTTCSATALPSPLLAPPTTNDLVSRPRSKVVRLLAPRTPTGTILHPLAAPLLYKAVLPEPGSGDAFGRLALHVHRVVQLAQRLRIELLGDGDEDLA